MHAAAKFAKKTASIPIEPFCKRFEAFVIKYTLTIASIAAIGTTRVTPPNNNLIVSQAADVMTVVDDVEVGGER